MGGRHYNGATDGYIDKDVTKTGTFTVLEDKFNNRTRYYVWGYNDKTRCCDFMWEINPEGVTNFPSVGSKVKVKGKFVAAEEALDWYWITNASVEVEKMYEPETKYDLDLKTMGGTLEMVQVANILNFAEDFSGKTIQAYGRMFTSKSIQHPYFDETFVMELDKATNFPIGAAVDVKGTLTETGSIANSVVSPTKN